MKKIIALLLAVILCMTLCACGGNKQSNDNNTTTSSTENNNEVIEFTDTVIFEDDNVKLELVNFFTEEVNLSTGKEIEKCFTVKTTNKSNKKISITPNNFYLNDEKVLISMKNGGMNPDPGKSGKYSFCVSYISTTVHGTALDSLEELYDLEGRFELYFVGEGTKYDIDFSVKDVLN